MSTGIMLLISTDCCCYYWDHHYFPQPPAQSERRAGSPVFFSLFLFWQTVLRTPQLDWNILFTGLFMVTDGLNGGVLKVQTASAKRREFFQNSLGPISIQKGYKHPIEVMVTAKY